MVGISEQAGEAAAVEAGCEGAEVTSVIKMSDILLFVTTWIVLGGIMLYVRGKGKELYSFIHTWDIK